MSGDPARVERDEAILRAVMERGLEATYGELVEDLVPATMPKRKLEERLSRLVRRGKLWHGFRYMPRGAKRARDGLLIWAKPPRRGESVRSEMVYRILPWWDILPHPDYDRFREEADDALEAHLPRSEDSVEEAAEKIAGLMEALDLLRARSKLYVLEKMLRDEEEMDSMTYYRLGLEALDAAYDDRFIIAHLTRPDAFLRGLGLRTERLAAAQLRSFAQLTAKEGR